MDSHHCRQPTEENGKRQSSHTIHLTYVHFPLMWKLADIIRWGWESKREPGGLQEMAAFSHVEYFDLDCKKLGVSTVWQKQQQKSEKQDDDLNAFISYLVSISLPEEILLKRIRLYFLDIL